MDELSRKFRSIDWKGLQKSARRVQASTASALKDMVMTDLENKVRAATADTSWGASGSDLMQIAQGTFNREDYALIMSIVWQRLGSSRWRCVYKALEVLRHLIMHGAARCAEEARAAAHHIETLQHYRYVDPKTRRDCGEGVRMRAKLVCDMLADDAVLEEEREKSKELRAKLQGGVSVGPGGRLGGMSSEDYRYGVGGGSGSSVYTTSTGGAGTFKGYGDDDDDDGGGAYDDAPKGTFAKRAAEEAGGSTSANVPDLLGDDTVEPTQNGGASGFDDDDDDDDFNPRAASQGRVSTAAPPAAAADDDLFGALALGEAGTQAAPPAHSAIAENAAKDSNSTEMPTSLLIQNLAQQQYQQQQQQQQQLQPYQPQQQQRAQDLHDHAQTPFDSANLNPNSDLASGGGIGFDIGLKESATGGIVQNNFKPQSEVKAPSKPMITSKPDADPFGDLVVTAKKSGVL